MLGEEGGKDATGQHEHGDDVFLKKIESHLLTQVTCPISMAYLLTCTPACKLDAWLLLTSQVCFSNKWAMTKCIVKQHVSHNS